jgi:type VI secretion system secreted protein Hcp
MQLPRARYLVFLTLTAALLWPGLAGAEFVAGVKIGGNAAIEGDYRVDGTNLSNDATWIAILAFGAGVSIPLDLQQQPSGYAELRPISFVKRWDRASPLLYKAIVDQEHIDEVEFRFFRPNPETGFPEHFFTILLTRVIVVDVSPSGSIASEDQRETWSMIFEQITWTDVATTTTHTYNISPQ